MVKVADFFTTLKSKNRLLVAMTVVCLLGLFQDPILINAELLYAAPELLPVFPMGGAWGNVVLTAVAALFLLFVVRDLWTLEWWISLFATMIPFVIAKAWGVYWDYTVYLIAKSQGRTIGGGAAFGHLFLGFFLLGPAQVWSAIVFFSVMGLRRVVSR